MSAEHYDAIVVGGGVAGMLTALELAPARVALVSHAALGEMTSSAWAQGGIAAAMGADDSPALHAADTVAAGAGLVTSRVATSLAADAPHAIERIVELGVHFDRAGGVGDYALGREAAHSRRRILRAGGDATGAELVRAVALAVAERPSIVVIARARALDLLYDAAARVAGVAIRRDGERAVLAAPVVVLATGGLGGLYRYTTNPAASRGSGIAIAARAGARLADLEFVQFHPTALDVPADPLPLVTEALRGEGARLFDAAGEPLRAGDPPLELAPRDVVARVVFAQRAAGRPAYLDARALAGELETRFPTVFASCRAYGIDPRLDFIPIVPAAHYHMGGIAVDLHGRTSVRGLYACGEVAATGVHGANRLASNSLLESVVYPERIARDVRAHTAALPHGEPLDVPRVDGSTAASPSDWLALRDLMYANVGVVREKAGLERAAHELAALATTPGDEEFQDAALVGSLVARAALGRHESRGGHFRSDFPEPVDGERHRSFAVLGKAQRSP